MTRKDALTKLKQIERESGGDLISRKAINENLRKYNLVGGITTVALEEINKMPAESFPKLERLYRWLNDMRLGIAPDETTPEDERGERQAQVDILDDIMAWIIKEPTDKEIFNDKCPYTGKPCHNSWLCNSCEVEKQEREFVEEMKEDRGEP